MRTLWLTGPSGNSDRLHGKIAGKTQQMEVLFIIPVNEGQVLFNGTWSRKTKILIHKFRGLLWFLSLLFYNKPLMVLKPRETRDPLIVKKIIWEPDTGPDPLLLWVSVCFTPPTH